MKKRKMPDLDEDLEGQHPGAAKSSMTQYFPLIRSSPTMMPTLILFQGL